MKYGLALHTSSPALGLAISSHTDDLRCQTWDLGRETSTYLQSSLRPAAGLTGLTTEIDQLLGELSAEPLALSVSLQNLYVLPNC